MSKKLAGFFALVILWATSGHAFLVTNGTDTPYFLAVYVDANDEGQWLRNSFLSPTIVAPGETIQLTTDPAQKASITWYLNHGLKYLVSVAASLTPRPNWVQEMICNNFLQLDDISSLDRGGITISGNGACTTKWVGGPRVNTPSHTGRG